MKTEKRTVLGQEVKRVSKWVRSSGIELHTARTLPKNMIERQLKYGLEHVGCSQEDIHQKNNRGKNLKGAWIFVDGDKRGRKFLSLESINYDLIDQYQVTCSSCGDSANFGHIRLLNGIYKYTDQNEYWTWIWLDFTDQPYVSSRQSEGE
tara:strand:+ start:827 stop:1276 length:450 start_codon:yes stop_codon:yes gene_type:complete